MKRFRLSKKYAVVEVEFINGEEYQDIMCYDNIFIPLLRFLTNKKISSIYRKSKKILARKLIHQ